MLKNLEIKRCVHVEHTQHMEHFEQKFSDAANVSRFLKTISVSCGVYIMKNADGATLYIGKAKNLRNRIRSYFRPSGLSHRIEIVMQQVSDIETIVTATETEALLLENNLIKSSKPHYNINLRDDKSYPYIRLDDSHEFPKLGFYRGNRKDPGRYFGPFSSASAVRETLSQLQKVFPVRQCRDSFYRHRSRPCLQYQIQRCTAPCVNLVGRDEYLEDVQQVVDFLAGRNQKLKGYLMERMEKSAAELDFETAAKYRDRISDIQRLRESQSVDGGSSDMDVIAVAEQAGVTCIQIVVIRSGRNIDYRNFFPKPKVSISAEDALAEFIPRYYIDREVPSEILIDRQIDEIGLIGEALTQHSGSRVTIRKPLRGAKVKLIGLALHNACDAIRRAHSEQQSFDQRLKALADALHIDDVPARIECFDISHTGGHKTVASCVVFDSCGPVKSEYRKLNVSGITGGDDYAALQIACTRRYSKVRDGQGKLPDLIMIDGGKGQLKSVLEVLDELQIADIKIAAISKGPQRKAGDEQIWLPEFSDPIEVDEKALLLLQQIRDEAHRFALVGHRSRRAKAQKQSILDQIPGIGQRRRSKLLNHFGGLQGIARAGVDELQQVPGISRSLAEKIHYGLHGD